MPIFTPARVSRRGLHKPKAGGSAPSSRPSTRRISSSPAERLTFVASLDLAKARVEATIYVVPGRGVVAEDRTEEIRVLGIFPRRSVERVVLTELETKP